MTFSVGDGDINLP